MTGLRVNPTKSEIILLYDNPSEEQKAILADFGMVKEHVTHLGVVISQDYSQARKLTYDAGKAAMKKAATKISTGNIEHKLNSQIASCKCGSQLHQ